MAVRTRLLGILNSVTHAVAAVPLVVPPNRTAVIRHWSVTNRSGEALVVTVNVRSGSTVATLQRHGSLAVNATMGEPQANIALGPQDQFEVTASGTPGAIPLHVILCGSLLDGAPE